MNAKILHAALFCPSPEGHWGLPVFLWGPPGIGKTHFVKDASVRTGLAYERLSPSERGEGQFGVCPVPQADGFLHYPAPDWSARFNNGGIIFVDELNTAPPALQAPLLGLVQLRALGSHIFPRRTRVLAAANEVQDAANGYDIPPALANRFGHFDFDGLGASDWAVALVSGFANLDDYEGPTTNAEAEEKRVMDAWPGAIAYANGIIAGFIKRRPELLHKQPAHAAAASSKAWPSRRSVHYAAVALASARIHGLNEIDTDTFMAGFVGLSFVTELRSFLAHLDLPLPEDVLDGRVNWKHDGRRLDRTLVVLQACAGLVAPEKAEKKKERGNKLWELIGTVLKDAADCAIPAARVLIAAKMVIPNQYPSYTDVGYKLLPILSQAGVVKG